MTDMSQTAWIWLAKGAGAVAGSAISLAYILPHGRREAAARFAVGVVCGLVFGGTAGLKIATELGIAGRDRTGRDDADGLGGREPVRLVGAGLRHARLRAGQRLARPLQKKIGEGECR